MNEYFFGTGNGKVSKAEQKRIQVALDGAGLERPVIFVALNKTPDNRPHYWFATENLGEPFDRQIAQKATAAVGAVKTMRN